MKKVIICLILVLFCFISYTRAQNTGKIIGTLFDSSFDRPLQSATVTLYPSMTDTPFTRKTSDTNGSFEFLKIPPGNYKVVIEFVGFQITTINNIIIKNGDSVYLGQISIARKTASLQTVVITATRKLVDNKIDKLIYNAENDITAQTGVATDLLKKVPQISVDADGNVELEGNKGVLFLINGKPSTIFGSNITDVLQSIPASQIKSIEVITNPGSKYDAQGTGGIINIILKHSTVQGISGNVSLTVGTLIQNGSINVNARKGAFGINVFANGNARLTTSTLTNLQRTSIDATTKTSAILQQNGSSALNRYGDQSGIGFDWNISELNIISGALNYADFGNKLVGNINQLEQTQKVSGGPYFDTSFISNNNSSFHQYSFDPSLSYTRKFKKKEQQLDIVFDGSFAHNLTTSGSDQLLQPQNMMFYSARNTNPAKENEYELKADYIQPLHRKITFGTGAKYSVYNISSIAQADKWDANVNQYLYDSALSNNLNYHQKVYALYTELSFPFGKLFDVRLGGRYERTQVGAYYANAGQQISNSYNTFIPSLFLLKKISETQTLKLNFTIRINRPDYGDLNPFVNVSDPKNISTGNPNLKPEIWDRLEASFNKEFGVKGSFMINLFYRQSNGDIQSFIVYYPSINIGNAVYSNVAVTTQKNIGVEKNMGTNLFGDFHLNEKLELRSNVIFFYRYTINQVDAGYNSTGIIFRSTISSSYQFASGFSAEFFGSFNSRHQEAQGNFPSFTSYSFSVRKTFWRNNGSIALTANNFLSEYINQRTDLFGPGFASVSLRNLPSRSVGVNFTWKFGKLAIKKEQPDDNRLDQNTSQQ